MPRVPKRAKLPKEKDIVVKIDPQDIRAGIRGISIPKASYEVKVIPKTEQEEAFTGNVLPIPKVLVFFLNKPELMLFAVILEDSMKFGECRLAVKEMEKLLRISQPTISNALYSLRKLGLLRERGDNRRGAGRVRRINFAALQHFDDLLADEDPGVLVRLRKNVRRYDISKFTKQDVREAYDHLVLPPGHDPAEEEEYD